MSDDKKGTSKFLAPFEICPFKYYKPEFDYSNFVKTPVNSKIRHFSNRNIGIFRCEKGK